MIINTGSRTDIPAFYSEWFMNRIREGYVFVRNPYYPKQVYRYALDPETAEILSFCTKNPGPMLGYMEELTPYRQFWYVTITPYGKDIEPNVPDKHAVIASFQKLSDCVGNNAIGWRYDPVFVDERYTIDYHIRAFSKIASSLKGYTNVCVISFIDLYRKTIKNFPSLREVTPAEQEILCRAFYDIARDNGMKIYACHESEALQRFGIDTSGCFTQAFLEKALRISLHVPSGKNPREGCTCLLGSDIGEYNTCAHFCRYCYANYDRNTVFQNMKEHDLSSPLLVGHLKDDDTVVIRKNETYLNRQLMLDL